MWLGISFSCAQAGAASTAAASAARRTSFGIFRPSPALKLTTTKEKGGRSRTFHSYCCCPTLLESPERAQHEVVDVAFATQIVARIRFEALPLGAKTEILVEVERPAQAISRAALRLIARAAEGATRLGFNAGNAKAAEHPELLDRPREHARQVPRRDLDITADPEARDLQLAEVGVA